MEKEKKRDIRWGRNWKEEEEKKKKKMKMVALKQVDLEKN
jgi:hypothetical protein